MVVCSLAALLQAERSSSAWRGAARGLDLWLRDSRWSLRHIEILTRGSKPRARHLHLSAVGDLCPLGQRSQLADRTRAQLEGERGPGFFLMVVRPLAAPSPGRTFEFCLERSSQGLDPLVKRLEMVIETYRNLNQRVQTPGLGTHLSAVGDLCPLGQRSQLADRTRAQLEGERGPGFFLMVVRPLAAPSPGRTFEFCLERSSQGLDPLVKRLEMVIETYRNLNQRVQTPGLGTFTYQSSW